jgi:hypothetical protein
MAISRKTAKIIIALTIISTLITGYGVYYVFNTVLNMVNPTPPPGSGDPGNIRLHVIANQPILKVLPPGATLDGKLQLLPASWNSGEIGGGGAGWNGESVIQNFADPTMNYTQVQEFYISVAKRYGWTPSKQYWSYPIPAYWTKKLPGGFNANFDPSPGDTNSTYELLIAGDTID